MDPDPIDCDCGEILVPVASDWVGNDIFTCPGCGNRWRIVRWGATEWTQEALLEEGLP